MTSVKFFLMINFILNKIAKIVEMLVNGLSKLCGLGPKMFDGTSNIYF